MADFGVKATQLSAPDTSAAKFVRKPVADESSNIILGTTLGMASDAYEGYQLADLEKEQEGVINEYMTSKAKLEQQVIDVATIKGAIDNIWEKATSVEELDEKASPIEKDFAEKTNKLNLALQQGVMTPAQFQDRILATTREAVNRNPGLYDKLLQHSKKMLGLSGIEGVLDADIASQKAQADTLKNLRELADKLNVSYNHFQPDYNQMQGEVIQRQREISASEQLTRGIAADSQVTVQTAKQFIATDGANAISGDAFTLKNAAMQMFQGATPQDYPKIKAKLRLDALERHNTFVAKTTQLGIRNDPAVKDTIADHKATTDYILATIESLESGEDAQKALDHAYSITVGTQKLGIAKEHNVGALEIMRLIPDPVLNSVMASGDGRKNFSNLFKLAQSITDKAVGGGEVAAQLSEYKDDPANPTAVKVGMGILDSSKTERQIKENSSAVISFFADGARPENFKTEEDRIKYLDSVMTQLADPKYKDKISKADTEALANAFKLTDQYFQTVGKWREKRFNEALTTGFLGVERSIPVYADLLPDGRITYSSPDPKTQQDFNRKFAGRINEGIGAMAALTGVSRMEAVKEILPRYRQIFGFETNIQTGPKAIKGKEKEFMAPEPNNPMQIPPDVQASRDQTRLRVLRMEIDDYSKQLQKETDPNKRKMIEDNIRFVTKELKQLEK